MAPHPDDTALTDLADLWSEAPDARRGPRLQRDRRGSKVGGIVAAVVIGALVLGGGGIATWAMTAPVPEPTIEMAVPEPPETSATAIVQPVTGGSAVVIAGNEDHLGAMSGARVGALNPDESFVLASITKLITALVILNAYPISGDEDGPDVTFTKADHDLYDVYYVQGATVLQMPTGTTVSLREALALMLVPSASNYADALATWAFGSSWAYADAARTWLDANGLTATSVSEPTGMNPENVTTATDMITLAGIAAANPVVAEIAARTYVDVPSGGFAYNTNELLGTHGVTGLKTGNLGRDTYGLLHTAKLSVGLPEPIDVRGVVLGSPSRAATNERVAATLDSIAANAGRYVLAARYDVVGTITTAWGSSADITVGADARITAWADTPITSSVALNPGTDFHDGDVVGTLTWTAGPEEQTVDLVMSGEITDPPAEWRLTHPHLLG